MAIKKKTQEPIVTLVKTPRKEVKTSYEEKMGKDSVNTSVYKYDKVKKNGKEVHYSKTINQKEFPAKTNFLLQKNAPVTGTKTSSFTTNVKKTKRGSDSTSTSTSGNDVNYKEDKYKMYREKVRYPTANKEGVKKVTIASGNPHENINKSFTKTKIPRKK